MAKIAKRRGRYVIDFYDHTGKRRWKTLPEGTTKKKANEELRSIEDQVKRSIYLPDRRIPKFSQVAEDYLEYARINVRASTLKASKPPKIRFHDLRHTFASLLIDQGENIIYIQNQLGHSKPTVTLDVYSHLIRTNNQAAARTLENTVFEQTGSKMVAKTKKGITEHPITP